MIETLTDEQCHEFRRMQCSFNDMVREIYSAGMKEEREACAKLVEEKASKTIIYRHEMAAAIRARK